MTSFGLRGIPGTSALSMSLPVALQELIDEAIAALRNEGVVSFPTDTLYGLAADFSSASAVRRVIEIKGRPEEMGIPLLISDADDLCLVASDVSEAAWSLARRFWPGALTLVVPRSSAVSDLITGGRNNVAVRVPNHPVPIALARGLGRPITGTSANRSGHPPSQTSDEVRCQLGNAVDMILEGGDIPHGIQSTILDVTGQVPRILRQGAVSISAIYSVCPGVVE